MPRFLDLLARLIGVKLEEFISLHEEPSGRYLIHPSPAIADRVPTAQMHQIADSLVRILENASFFCDGVLPRLDESREEPATPHLTIIVFGKFPITRADLHDIKLSTQDAVRKFLERGKR